MKNQINVAKRICHLFKHTYLSYKHFFEKILFTNHQMGFALQFNETTQRKKFDKLYLVMRLVELKKYLQVTQTYTNKDAKSTCLLSMVVLFDHNQSRN